MNSIRAFFKSIKGVKIDPSLAFDERKGVFRHDQGLCIPSIFSDTPGRISGTEDVFCAGWIKTGPVGVILNSMNDAFQTAATLLQSLNTQTDRNAERSPDDIAEVLRSHGIRVS